MRIHILFTVLLLLSLTSAAYGASCPYCGRVYGEGGRRDRAYIERIRQEHEATCPSRFQESPTYAPQPDYDYEAERQRQKKLEELRKEEEATKKRRDEEFELDKQEARKSMKGITEKELGGLKGTGSTGDLSLKGVGDTGAEVLGLKGVGDAKTALPVDSSVVDLRFLNPNTSISVDPNVAKGKERVFPVQPDPETFRNANYNKGFEALMRFDAASAAAAVQYFKQAQKERPKDPLVRNALLLSEDICRARQKKEQDNKARAANWTMKSLAALMKGEPSEALAFIKQASDLAPGDRAIRALASFTEKVAQQRHFADTPEKRASYKMVGNSMVSLIKGNYNAAVGILEAAQGLNPNDQFIASFLLETRNYEAELTAMSKGKKK